MTKKNIAILGVIATLAIVVVVGVLMNINYDNKEIALSNQMKAQQQTNEAVFDNMWKILKGSAQVADQYKETFKEIYPQLIEGRYGNEKGGTLMKWIQESNPNFDVKLYAKLQNQIEAQRQIFLTSQKKLIDLKREHDDLRMKFPSNVFVDADEFVINIITSTRTERIFEEGKEENFDLFEASQ